MAMKKQRQQLDECPSESPIETREYMDNRLEIIKNYVENKMNKLFLPGELNDEQPINFDD